MEIAATITRCVQLGMETYKDIPTTKVFDDTASIADIMAWAETYGTNDFPSITFGHIDKSKGTCPLIGCRCDKYEEQVGDFTCDDCEADK